MTTSHKAGLDIPTAPVPYSTEGTETTNVRLKKASKVQKMSRQAHVSLVCLFPKDTGRVRSKFEVGKTGQQGWYYGEVGDERDLAGYEHDIHTREIVI